MQSGSVSGDLLQAIGDVSISGLNDVPSSHGTPWLSLPMGSVRLR